MTRYDLKRPALAAVFAAVGALLAAILPARLYAFGSLFEEGDGSPGAPYIVASAEDLKAIEDAPGACYRLEEDVRLFGEAWTPLCSETEFTGVLDGAGKTISGMTVVSGELAGLFAKVGAGARISDLTVEGCVVVGKETLAAGGLAGLFDGAATGISSLTTFVVDSSCGKADVGGIAGRSGGYVAYSTFGGVIADLRPDGGSCGAIVGLRDDHARKTTAQTPLPTLVTAHAGFAAQGGVNDTSEDNTLRNIVRALRFRPDVVEVDARYVEGVGLAIAHNAPKDGSVPTLESVFRILMGELPAELADEEFDPEIAKRTKIQLDAKQDGLFKAELELMARVGFPCDRVIMAGDARYETVMKNVELIRGAVGKGMEFWMNPNMIDSYESMAAKSDAFLDKIRALDLPVFTVNSFYGAITPDVEAWLRANGLNISMWTLNSDEAIRQSFLRGAHNVTSRLPEIIRARDELTAKGVYRNEFDKEKLSEVGE